MSRGLGDVYKRQVAAGHAGKKGKQVIRGLLFALIVFLVATFPATWLLMLFLGNLGLELSYWATLPMGILVSALLAGSSSSAGP